ncbi:MAG TPA: transposase [Ktedonobacteraceae bacterium]|nr:transposase [Ktedonobacteraceae bacterium]
MKKRRTFSAQFKAQVVLEVLSGAKRAAQVCREHSLKDTLLARWKQEFIERAPELFAGNQVQNQQAERIAELEQLVGRLTLEAEMAKKALLHVNSRWHANGSL